MIKKLIMVAAVLGSWATMAHALTINVPQGPLTQLATSDYGGVSYSTITFSTQTFLLSDTWASVTGFVASSNTAMSDYIVFYDTPALLSTRNEQPETEFARVYLTTIAANTTSIFPGSPVLGTSYKFPASIRTKRGLVARSSAGNLNMLTILYTKFGE